MVYESPKALATPRRRLKSLLPKDKVQLIRVYYDYDYD